ncbi:10597_t:CDS:2 [Paraglomus brasilianum]|uniref:10597_t:CDS:1 n=1 Tax=Paraglomus brasilianum TaxID=144538 RepID=A0A9N8ZRD9_9GLOM|nr:10597_t:CDS:2 [Paraglomus brasilianum]
MSYFVVLETGFVNAKDTDAPIPGINRQWKFRTSSIQPQDVYSPSTTAIISLTPSGSSHFLELSNSDLSAATSDSEMGVDSVLKDLDVIIKDKAITMASRIPETVLVDENYGVHIEPNLWNEYKLNVIIGVAAVFLIGLLYLLARRINPEAQNSAIFTLALVLYDFVVDVAFIVMMEKTCSILILIIAVVYSVTMALYIMITENTRSSKFIFWTQSYSQIAAVFTVIAAANIEVLTVICVNGRFSQHPSVNEPIV